MPAISVAGIFLCHISSFPSLSKQYIDIHIQIIHWTLGTRKCNETFTYSVIYYILIVETKIKEVKAC